MTITTEELLPALHEIKWVPGQHYAIQLDEHYKRLHAAYLALVAERDRLRAKVDQLQAAHPDQATRENMAMAARMRREDP